MTPPTTTGTTQGQHDLASDPHGPEHPQAGIPAAASAGDDRLELTLTHTNAGPVRVLVVDDHRVVAQLLSAAVRAQSDMASIGHVQSAGDALTACLDERPDVVLVDVDLPGSDGIGLTADLVAFLPEVRVVVMSSVADRSTLRRANAAGASAFVPKDFPLEDMLAAIRSSRRGTMWTPSELDTHLKDLEETDSVDDGGLTPRELDVLRLLGEGRSVQQISRQLGISVHTTRGYVKAILAKLGVSSQLEAVLVATRRRIIARS